MRIRGALFDLDGTLLDTAGDLAAAANRMLAALERAERPPAEIASYVGKGIRRLVERCLTGELDRRANPELLERALELFSEAYDEESGRHATVYPGVMAGLDALEAEGILLGCVTNKTARFSLPLLERMGFADRFKVVVSGDSVERTKPDPMPYTYACQRLALEPAEAVAVGDSENDVISARAAGLRVLCVPYGYREGRPVESLGADAIVPDLKAVAEFLRKSCRR